MVEAAPHISILTPICNAEAFLGEAIDSVLAQTSAPPWELLLIDDGSSDGSEDVAQRYVQHFPARVRLLRHPDGTNRGTSAARNLGLDHARGSLVALLDADDVWLPSMLATQLALMRQHSQAAMVYANAERTWNMKLAYEQAAGPLGDNFLPALLPRGRRAGLLMPQEPLTWFLRDETLTPCTCTVLVRTAAARAVGGFEKVFAGLYDDQAFYAKIATSYRVAVTTACVARYRVHAASCCGQGWRNRQLRQNARARFDRWLASYQERSSCKESDKFLAAD